MHARTGAAFAGLLARLSPVPRDFYRYPIEISRLPKPEAFNTNFAMWKDGKTLEQVAREVLRSYLVRCHSSIASDYPEVANMTAERSADYLIHLRDTGRITIELFNKGSSHTGCKITDTGGAEHSASLTS